jgi:hypothetical protein
MPRLSASLVFLLASTLTLAQTPSKSGVPKNSRDSTSTPGKTGESVIFYENRLDNFGCPVGFFASRQGNSQIMTASDAAQAGPAQGLHLILNHLNAPAIQSIEVTVYGVSPRAMILPAGSQSNDSISKTFELQRKAGSSSLSDADVWMHNVGSLNRVDLISITYADGSTWHATDSLKCRVVPSNFVLVGRR